MNFLVDENIPLAHEAFNVQGRVTVFSGRQPSIQDLAETEVLLVRSVTQVNQQLLQQASKLKFVGTATIGTEHVDMEALQQRGIGFASAPGANADSVGEYVLTALLALAEQQSWQLAGRRVAIVGAGNTGIATGKRLSALGMQVGYYDPPLQEQGKQAASYMTWAEVLQADVISLHVPLQNNGRYKTRHLLAHKELAQLGSSQVLINASRGAVINNQALLQRQQEKPLWLILDVWEGEPQILQPLLEKVAIATPHIAGYSLNGKVRATQMLYQACSRYFAWQQAAPDWQKLMPDLRAESWHCDSTLNQQQLAHWALENYPIWRDDRKMRERGVDAQGFDALRKEYPPRYELMSRHLECDRLSDDERERLQQLGFNL
ncbi:4-phosphoerythronate dehydrogenase [Aliidiomarina minuta]|nr:4-phosphoerythronate dehydrogenase [Aliidiomarina minuta]